MNEFRLLRLRIIVTLTLAAFAPVSCASNTPKMESNAKDLRVVALKQAPSLKEVVRGLDGYRAIFVGETHTRYDHHLVQLEVLRLLQQSHQPIAIGVEWFQFPFQGAIDDYLAGRTTEAEMLERTEYFDRWRFDYRLYRPIIEYARTHKLPIVALNAPQEVTHQISTVGISALPAKLKAQLPVDYDRTDRAYTERIKHQFEQHPGEKQKFENFLNVMLTWDETMAEQAAKYLRAHPDHRMVIFAGSGHVAFGSGIPRRLSRRIGEPGITLLVGMDGVADQNAADYVVLSRPRTLPPVGLLGAYLEQSAGGVKIADLSENSAVKESGIVKGDLILAIDGTQVRTVAAIKLALLDRKPGDTVAVRYQHNNWLGKVSERNAEVELRGPTAAMHP